MQASVHFASLASVCVCAHTDIVPLVYTKLLLLMMYILWKEKKRRRKNRVSKYVIQHLLIFQLSFSHTSSLSYSILVSFIAYVFMCELCGGCTVTVFNFHHTANTYTHLIHPIHAFGVPLKLNINMYTYTYRCSSLLLHRFFFLLYTHRVRVFCVS